MHMLFRRTLGIVLIVVGVLALVTPFTPGSWLIFVGAELLGWELIFARKVAAYVLGRGQWVVGVLCILAPFVAGGVGALFTTPNIASWYDLLIKPSWTPPSWVFAPVWTTLYLLMGIAAFLVWRAGKSERVFSVSLFFAHLAVNALWSVLFFGLHQPLYALAVIVMLWFLILWLILLFRTQSRTAAWLLVPYLLWVTYASTLNLGILLLN